MAIDTKIPWADSTLGFWIGCDKITPACTNCYAAAYGRRFGIPWGPEEPRYQVKGRLAKLRKIIRRAKQNPRRIYRVFVNSQSDFFDPAVPHEWRIEAFEAMLAAVREAPNIRFLLLTKRIGQVPRLLRAAGLPPDFFELHAGFYLGVTAEDQPRARVNIKKLAKIKARVRFVSAEPLLSKIQLDGLPVDQIHWIIIGGESGAGARPFAIAAAWELLQQARRLRIKVFMKQFGARPVDSGPGGVERPLKLKERVAGTDMAEWPRKFRVRQFPKEGRRAPVASTA